MDNAIKTEGGEIKKNRLFTAGIDGYSSDGSGVCHIEGRAVFVPLALAGERWEIRILKATASAVYGRGERLILPSPARTCPACPVFGRCGGCDLMHMGYEQELELKLDRVRDAVLRIGGQGLPVSEIIPAPAAEGYRNKAVFAIGGGRGKGVDIGFYRRRSHSIVPVECCAIQADVSNRAALAVRRFIENGYADPYDEATGEGELRHVFSRYALGTGEAMAVAVTARAGLDEAALVKALLESCPELASIQLCVNPGRGNTILSGALRTLWGRDYIEDTLGGLRFRLSARSFYQINPPQAERLYEEAARMADAGGGGLAVDLYCGAGTISLFLVSRGFDRVVGIESVPEAVSDARQNASKNGVSNAEFILADAAECARELIERRATPRAVIVDPPRKGLSRETIGAIAGMSPERLVYISCDPATFARDLRLLGQQGYAALEIKALDMFPRCSNVETVALFRRV